MLPDALRLLTTRRETSSLPRASPASSALLQMHRDTVGCSAIRTKRRKKKTENDRLLLVENIVTDSTHATEVGTSNGPQNTIVV